MSRPKNKSELLNLSQENYSRLENYINSLGSLKTAEFPEGTMNRNIRDVLAHLHHWHLMFMDWYKTGMAGSKPEMPAKGFTWKTVPELNQLIWNMYRFKDLDEVQNLFAESHEKMIQKIEMHSNEELFQKKRYAWTGSTSLGAYMISATSSHYDWAFKLIKKCIKGIPKPTVAA